MADIKGLKLKPQDFQVNPDGHIVITNEKVNTLLKDHSLVTPQGKINPDANPAAISVGVVVGT